MGKNINIRLSADRVCAAAGEKVRIVATFDQLAYASVNERREKAIKEHTEKERLRKAELESPFFMPTDFVSGFKAGAKWQEEREKEKK